MLDHGQIRERASRYACCSFAHLVDSMEADIVGDTACAKKAWKQSLKAYWASEVMSGTVLDGGCYTVAYASQVAESVDCICKTVYGCKCPEPIDCTIVPDYTVSAVVEELPIACGLLVDALVMWPMDDPDTLTAYAPAGEFGGRTLYESLGNNVAFVAWSASSLAWGFLDSPDEGNFTFLANGDVEHPWQADWSGARYGVRQGTNGDLHVECEDLPEGTSLLVASTDETFGQVATFEGGAWQQVPVANGQVIDVDGVLWTQVSGVTMPLFPTVTMELVGGPYLWSLTQWAVVNANRVVQLEGLGPNGWYAMWQGTEADLPLNVNLLGLPFSDVRLRYRLENGCEYTSPIGTTIPDPPDACGTIEVAITVKNDCMDWAFDLEVDIQEVSGFPLGNLVFTVNGEDQPPVPAEMGSHSYGPWAQSDEVFVRITNAANTECDRVEGPFVGTCEGLNEILNYPLN